MTRKSGFMKAVALEAGGTECPPETSDREMFAEQSGKKRQGKMEKGENGEEEKENCKREGVKLKWKEGKFQKEERTFCFVFCFCFCFACHLFFVLFCFVLFLFYFVCFACHFSNFQND